MGKKKVLCWSDSPTAGTGFGVVSKHVIQALYDTGKYDIDQLAINFHGDFVDEVPWKLQPARLLDPKDPHGIKMFARTLAKKDYDIVWILNDIFVTHEAEGIIHKIRDRAKAQNRKCPIFVYYYPVDCKVQPDHAGMLRAADVIVCYTDHGRNETIATVPEAFNKIQKIPHGVDTTVFRPLDPSETAVMKQTVFQMSPETTLVMNVNRNSTRKQIPYSMLAFKEFRKYVPDSKMYLHTMFQDQGGDMRKAMEDLGFEYGKDLLFPARYSPAQPAPTDVLNQIYNCADIFLTTHLGEGWGLTVTEAMACGIPVVAPNNTAMPEQLGANSERGYLYPCNDQIWIDNSGFRPKGNIDDIVQKMLEAYHAGPKQDNPVTARARDWAVSHDWRVVCREWVQLFDSLDGILANNQPNVVQEI